MSDEYNVAHGWTYEAGPTRWGDPAQMSRVLEGGWVLRVTVEAGRDNTLVFGRIEIEPVDPSAQSRGITSTMLSGLRIGKLLREARGTYWEMLSIVREAEDDSPDWSAWTRHPGARGHSDALYAELASVYVHEVQAGDTRPIQTVARYMKCTAATANTRIAEARKRGLLTAPISGRVGGRLTDTAKRLLGLPEEAVVDTESD